MTEAARRTRFGPDGMAKKKQEKRKPGLDREQALNARPVPLTVLKTEELDDGSLRVTVRYNATRLQRFFGAPREYERPYTLDVLGRTVYELCDGQRTVKDVIRAFAREHQVARAEAAVAITQYMKTLVGKGLVAMAVDPVPEDEPD